MLENVGKEKCRKKTLCEDLLQNRNGLCSEGEASGSPVLVLWLKKEKETIFISFPVVQTSGKVCFEGSGRA